MDETEGVVLQLNSGFQPYREYLMAGAAKNSPLWLIDDEPVGWPTAYVRGSDVVELLAGPGVLIDDAGLIAAAEAVDREHGVRGVYTYDEPSVDAAALLADHLGLPGLTVAGAARCRNKQLAREAFTAAGLLQPRFEVADTLEQAVAIADRIGYPVVIKPRGMAASIGVALVETPEELAGAFEIADRTSRSGPVAYHGGVLIEEMIDGPEISIDGAVADGEYTPFCIAEKQLGPPPYFEEIGHIVDGANPLLADEVFCRMLQDAHTAIGTPWGLTHSEVRFGPRGPVVIEINGRLGGDMIPYVGKLANGVDPGTAAVDVARGIRPDLRTDHASIVGIRFCYPPEDARIVDIVVPEAGAVPGLLESRPLVSPGAQVRLPPRARIGRHAYVICTADDAKTCDQRLTAAAELVELKYDALDENDYSGRPW